MADPRLEPLVLSQAERRTLENWVRRRSTAQGLALRARIVLACAQGGSNTAVAARLGVNFKTVSRWRARFLARRLDTDTNLQLHLLESVFYQDRHAFSVETACHHRTSSAEIDQD